LQWALLLQGKERKSMRVQDIPPYTYHLFQDEASSEYVAECHEIPGLSGVGETAPEALAELREAIAGWLEVLEEQGKPFPSPVPHALSADTLRKTA
jgi:predicted RNase H-like HicB family nuclease